METGNPSKSVLQRKTKPMGHQKVTEDPRESVWVQTISNIIIYVSEKRLLSTRGEHQPPISLFQLRSKHIQLSPFELCNP